jgi:hypothetical protein
MGELLLRLIGWSETPSPLIDIVHEHRSILVFVFLTLLLGGGGAYSAGAALARGWAPIWKAVAAAFGLSLFVRFLHFSLFDGTLVSPYFWAMDFVILAAIGALGWQRTRVTQMTSQYRWLYERSGPLSWREKAAAKP